jgi:hypothetical protein
VAGAFGARVGANSVQGAVYVFGEPDAGWASTSTFTAKLTASDGAFNDQLGNSVAIRGNGRTVVAGAPRDTVGANSQQGAVYVFGVMQPPDGPGSSPGTDPSSGREIPMGISALPATASPSMDSMPMTPSSGRDRDAYALRLESGNTADSEARLAEALTEVFTSGDPAQGLSWQPALLPLEALDGFYSLSAN